MKDLCWFFSSLGWVSKDLYAFTQLDGANSKTKKTTDCSAAKKKKKKKEVGGIMAYYCGIVVRVSTLP